MGVFVRMNETVKRLLTISEPYIIYGVPSAEVVRELVYKRGVGRDPPGAVRGYKKVTLSDNRAIEDALGEHGIICIDDIIQEVHEQSANVPNYTFSAAATTNGSIRARCRFHVAFQVERAARWLATRKQGVR